MKMLRRLRLIRGTWRARLRDLADRVTLYFQRRTCPHSYRPALVNSKPGRVCPLCDTSEELSREDFYAQFGERGMGIIGGR